MSFFNKIKWVLGVLMVFGIIAATNLIDKNNFVRVKQSVETIYEDRLLAKGYIFEMLKEIHKKEIAVVSGDSSFFKLQNESVNLKLSDLSDRFGKTRLTEKEAEVLADLEKNLEDLMKREKEFIEKDYTEPIILLESLEIIEEDLNILSSIQLEEGKKELRISKKAVENVELFTQIEIYVLIVMAVIIQIIVMYNPRRR